MRVSSAAIFTLVSLATGNASQQALAAPSDTPDQAEKPDNLVVPVTEETPARVEAIAHPETVVIGQFSQKSGSVQSGGSHNSVVIAPQKDKQTPEQQTAQGVGREITFPSSPSSSSSSSSSSLLALNITMTQIQQLKLDRTHQILSFILEITLPRFKETLSIVGEFLTLHSETTKST